MTSLTRHNGQKTSVAAISVLASGSLALAKLVVGIAIGSLALISEALHSSIDLVATTVTWAVVRVSDMVVSGSPGVPVLVNADSGSVRLFGLGPEWFSGGCGLAG